MRHNSELVSSERFMTAIQPLVATSNRLPLGTDVRNRTASTCGYRLKRLLDASISGVMLISLSPLICVIAVIIKLSSPGPVFYRQRRLGLHERPFTILKFRSMGLNADKNGPPCTATNDPRITTVGRILRRLSLDELPQLINVVRGDMSLFGPRPYVGFELEEWSPEQRLLRASVRPGLSGLSQASGRSSMTVEEIIWHDLEYVTNCGLLFDSRIAIRTALAVLLSRGTN